MTSYMSIITETAELAEFCGRAAAFPYITVDTEFIREKALIGPGFVLSKWAPPTKRWPSTHWRTTST